MSIHLIASARSARDRLRDVSLSQPGSRLMLKWVGYRGSNPRTGFQPGSSTADDSRATRSNKRSRYRTSDHRRCRTDISEELGAVNTHVVHIATEYALF